MRWRRWFCQIKWNIVSCCCTGRFPRRGAERMDADRFNRAMLLFDDANRQDPNRTIVNGADHPDALLYARRMSEWLHKLVPDASEPLRLAARSQHLMRWQ